MPDAPQSVEASLRQHGYGESPVWLSKPVWVSESAVSVSSAPYFAA